MTLSAILELIAEIETAGQLENTKERVANVLRQMVRSSNMPFDPLIAYKVGETAIWNGVVYTAKNGGTNPGENPTNMAVKWQSSVTGVPNLQSVTTSGASTNKQLTFTGGLKLSGMSVATTAPTYIISINQTTNELTLSPINDVIPEADELTPGLVRASTDEGLLTIDDPDSYVTQRQFAQFRAEVLAATMLVTYEYPPGTKILTVYLFAGSNTAPEMKLEGAGNPETGWRDLISNTAAGPGYYKLTFTNVVQIGFLSIRPKNNPGPGVSFPVIPQGIELGPLARRLHLL